MHKETKLTFTKDPFEAKVSPRHRRPLPVAARTFGCRDSFALETINVSRTGMLLGAFKGLPFQVNTLLEIVIDPNSSTLHQPVHAIGKVIRFAKEEGAQDPRFCSVIGIHLSQEGTGQAFDQWTRWVDKESPTQESLTS